MGNLQLDVDYDSILSYNPESGDFTQYPGNLANLEPNKAYYIHCLRAANWDIQPLSRTTDFYYDGDGGRVKRVSRIDRGQTTVYIGSLFEIQSTAGGGESTKRHIFAGANRVCTIEGTVPERGLSLRYYHSDHLGSSNVITNEDGEQVSRMEYSPFGEVAFQDGSYSTDIKYTGKIQDDTGLYYYGARYYDPWLGRFITPDTIVQAPFDPQSLNRYSYCRNNPINLIDPTGHWWFIIAAIIKFAIAHPIITGAIVGAITNTAFNAHNIHNFGNFATFAGIGALSGSIGAGAGLGASGFLIGKGVGTGLANLVGVLASGFAGGFVGGSANALSQGASFGSAMASGALSGLISAGTAVAVYGVAQGITKVVNVIKHGQSLQNAGGAKTPVGQQGGKGSATGSLSTNKGESASNTQALSSRGTEGANSEQIDRIVIKRSDAIAYRQGKFADESTGWEGNLIKGGQWATENPLTTTDYSQKYGLPVQNTGKPDWVVTGRIQGEYGMQPAPGSYNNLANTGGAAEILPKNPNNVTLDSFYMPED